MNRKVGIVITVFNRPEYLRRTFESIGKTNFPDDTILYVYNDGSTDSETIKLFNGFSFGAKVKLKRYCWLPPETININGVKVVKFDSKENRGMFTGLEYCWDKAVYDGCNVLCNLDSDVLVKPDWILKEISLLDMFDKCIVTGFNTRSGGRHKIIDYGDGYCAKKTIGGINMMFKKSIYEKVVKPSLQQNKLRWDWGVCENSYKHGIKLICTLPSVIQHTGIESSVEHGCGVDIAFDFYSEGSL